MEKIINMRSYFSTGATLDIEYRIQNLQILHDGILEWEPEIKNALKEDLNKGEFEAYLSEIGLVLHQIKEMIKQLRKWSKRKYVKIPISQLYSKAWKQHEPYGVVLIITPWNYPFQLAFDPLAGAIAAGNCVVIKPSEFAPSSSKVLKEMLSSIYQEDYVSVIEGDVSVSEELLKEKFDYIFFTGSTEVGKIVMRAAAEHLTPVTLELGGKSPVIVDETANIKLAGRRITFGKLLNSGQTCITPDYILVHESVRDALVSSIIDSLEHFLKGNEADIPKIINQKNYNRLKTLIEGEKVIYGGKCLDDELTIIFTLVNAKWDSEIMKEEIFGPILPILEYEDIDSVISTLKTKPKPLALYLFTDNIDVENKVLKNLSFGGGCINDTVIHHTITGLPFGGVGDSGMGVYHGKYSFETFSHLKGVLKKSNALDIKTRYRPYTGSKYSFLRKILK